MWVFSFSPVVLGKILKVLLGKKKNLLGKNKKITMCGNRWHFNTWLEGKLDFECSISDWFVDMMSWLKSWPWKKVIIYYYTLKISFCQLLLGKNVLGKKQLCPGKNLKFYYLTTNYYYTNNKSKGKTHCCNTVPKNQKLDEISRFFQIQYLLLQIDHVYRYKEKSKNDLKNSNLHLFELKKASYWLFATFYKTWLVLWIVIQIYVIIHWSLEGTPSDCF